MGASLTYKSNWLAGSVARRKIGLHMRNWIIWHYTFGQQTKKMFAKSHTHILYFTKQKPDPGMTNLTFNADAVRVASLPLEDALTPTASAHPSAEHPALGAAAIVRA